MEVEQHAYIITKNLSPDLNYMNEIYLHCNIIVYLSQVGGQRKYRLLVGVWFGKKETSNGYIFETVCDSNLEA